MRLLALDLLRLLHGDALQAKIVVRGVRYLRTRGAGGAGALVDTVWLVSAVVLSMGGC
jgi:hypothetical protein